MTHPRVRLLIAGAVFVFSLFFIYPPGERIRLGLDLQGGVRLVLRVHTDEALQRATDSAAHDLRERLAATAPSAVVERTGPSELLVTGIADAAGLRAALSPVDPPFDLDVTSGVHVARMRPEAVHRIRDETMQRARAIVERRVDALGVAEAVVTRHRRQDRLDVQLPGITEVERARQIIRSTAQLRLTIVERGPFPTREAALETADGMRPAALEILPYAPAAGGAETYYVVRAEAAVAGADLRSARASVDEFNRPAVAFTLQPEAGRRFGELTAAHVGRLLATVLDDRITSVATIQSRIDTQGRITGMTREAMLEQVVTLGSGALPASMTYVEDRTIGPTLGADSVRAGMLASAAGFVLVLLFMIGYYRVAGAIAAVSVLLNLIVLLALLVAVGAAMTLPGIAALVLTIGIGVDSNVLIFERIKEELARARGAGAAVHAGFRRVWTTIIDTHVASLVAAAFLFQFGSGPVSGFATTLALGLVANVFTAVFVSRALFDLLLSRRRPAQTLSI